MEIGEALRTLAAAGIPVVINMGTINNVQGDMHIDNSVTRNFALGDVNYQPSKWVGRLEDKAAPSAWQIEGNSEQVKQLESGDALMPY